MKQLDFSVREARESSGQIMPAPIVLLSSELERMRLSAQSPPITDSEARRSELKAKSDKRVAKWSNTLSAMREKKLLWKKERLEKEEKERQEKDRAEAEIRHQERLELLQRANSMLNEQTDLMKGFRSAQLYSDILATRDKQVRERSKREKHDSEKDKIYFEMVVEQMAEYDAKEDATAKKLKDTEKLVAKIRMDKILEARARKAAEKEAERIEGQEILEKSKAEIEEDRQKAWERTMWHRRNNEAMTKANIELQVLRKELAKEEAKEDAKIAACVKQKEATALARRQLEKDRFEAKQMIRKRMIDRACAELAKKTNNENAIMEKQAQKQRDKEDAELARRAERRKKQQEAIDRSRHLTKQLQEERKRAEEEATKEQGEIWRKRNAELDREERELEELRYRRNMELRQFHEKQIQLAAKRAEEERLSQVLGEAQGLAIKYEDRDRFTAYVLKEIERAKEAGKPLYPLLQAMNVKHEPLFASKPNPSKAAKQAKGQPSTPAPVGAS